MGGGPQKGTPCDLISAGFSSYKKTQLFFQFSCTLYIVRCHVRLPLVKSCPGMDCSFRTGTEDMSCIAIHTSQNLFY